MYVRLVHLWGARAKHAVIMRFHPPGCLGMPRIFLPASHPATALGLHQSKDEPCWHF
jgi:hypothetical protein